MDGEGGGKGKGWGMKMIETVIITAYIGLPSWCTGSV
jgi:hypothetical protein